MVRCLYDNIYLVPGTYLVNCAIVLILHVHRRVVILCDFYLV